MDYLPLDMVDRLYGVIHNSYSALLENQAVLQLFVRRLGLFATEDDSDGGTEPAVHERRLMREARKARAEQNRSEREADTRPWIAGTPPKALRKGGSARHTSHAAAAARHTQSGRPAPLRATYVDDEDDDDDGCGGGGGDGEEGGFDVLPGAVVDDCAPPARAPSSAALAPTRSGWRFSPRYGEAGKDGAATGAGGGEDQDEQQRLHRHRHGRERGRRRGSRRGDRYRVESAQSIDADRAAGRGRARQEPVDTEERFLLVRASSGQWQPRALHASKSCAIL